MRRRAFVGNLLGASALRAWQAPESPVADTGVKRVLVMFKCHLDLGFVDTQTNVVKKYFDPLLSKTAFSLRTPC
jgi:hypothetical protein